MNRSEQRIPRLRTRGRENRRRLLAEPEDWAELSNSIVQRGADYWAETANKLSFLTQICDLTFADAVRNDGYISEERRVEAEILCRTYLAFHLPAWLPARGQGHS